MKLIKTNLIKIIGLSFSSIIYSNPENIIQKSKIINAALLKIEDGKNILFVAASEILTPGPDKAKLAIVEPPSMKAKNYFLPQDFEGEQIVAILPSSNKQEVFLITQLRKAGLSTPNLISFNIEKNEFKTLQKEILCPNTLNYKIQKGLLTLDCGPDPMHPPKSKKLKIKNPNFIADLNASKFEWVPKKPNSMDEAEALMLKLEKNSFYLSAEALLK
jgi:hypothetical protein